MQWRQTEHSMFSPKLSYLTDGYKFSSLFLLYRWMCTYNLWISTKRCGAHFRCSWIHKIVRKHHKPGLCFQNIWFTQKCYCSPSYRTMAISYPVELNIRRSNLFSFISKLAGLYGASGYKMSTMASFRTTVFSFWNSYSPNGRTVHFSTEAFVRLDQYMYNSPVILYLFIYFCRLCDTRILHNERLSILGEPPLICMEMLIKNRCVGYLTAIALLSLIIFRSKIVCRYCTDEPGISLWLSLLEVL